MRKNMYGCHDALCQFGNDFTPGMITRWGERKRERGRIREMKICWKNTNTLMLVYFMWCIGRKKDLPIINFAQSEPTKSFIGKAHC